MPTGNGVARELTSKTHETERETSRLYRLDPPFEVEDEPTDLVRIVILHHDKKRTSGDILIFAATGEEGVLYDNGSGKPILPGSMRGSNLSFVDALARLGYSLLS